MGYLGFDIFIFGVIRGFGFARNDEWSNFLVAKYVTGYYKAKEELIKGFE